MNVEIVNTGSELMLGRVLNTHQQWLCRRLSDLGHTVTRQVAIADTAEDIQTAVREALPRADLIITTGGLGPTSDDLTRELIAALLGKKLMPDAAVLAHIEGFFAKRNRPRPARTDVETMVPEGATVFLNPTGTAPGLAMRTTASGVTPARWLVMLPGPPRELRPMFDQCVVPLLGREFADAVFVCRTLRTSGIGESVVQDMVECKLQPLVARGLGVGYCARPGAVDVRLTAGGGDAKTLVAEGEKMVEQVFGASVFGRDDEEVGEVVVHKLRALKKTVALAESCTGGIIADLLTDVPGASEVFLGGVVSYAHSAKEQFLGVKAESLAAHGAVSETVAREMADGARSRFGADYALAVTGLAGPGGGTEQVPVGTVYIALATASGVEVKKMLNPWDRLTFKQVTATQALAWLLRVAGA